MSLALLPVLGAASVSLAGADDGRAGATADAVEREGVSIEFRIAPLDASSDSVLIEQRDAAFVFTIMDPETGAPLRGLYPSAWMDTQRGGQSALSCRDKVRSYVSGRLSFRPQVDLNTWYALTLNEKASVSVIDPLINLSATQMLALVLLDGPGKDWVSTADTDRLFVTQPDVDRVAVVDARRWRVAEQVEAGPRPGRIELQADGRRVWVANDTVDGGVSAIDVETLEVVARLRTGGGAHDLAVSADDRYVGLTNPDERTVSILDARELVEEKRIHTRGRPVAIDHDPRAGAFLVVDDVGQVLVIDVKTLEVRTRISTEPGAVTLRVSPSGRWGFVLNGLSHRVEIIDTATDGVRHTVAVGEQPDQIAFTENYAYVRSLGSERMTLIDLAGLDGEGSPPVIQIPTGQTPPGDVVVSPAAASPIAAAPDGAAVLIANPADEMIYYYGEGMNAPMGGFRNFKRQARAVMVVDRSLRETAPGAYETTVRLPGHGIYDVAFLLDSPRVVHCFSATVLPDPELQVAAAMDRRHVEYLIDERTFNAGEQFTLRFRLSVGLADEEGLPAVRVLNMLVPGTWRERVWARALDDGVYEASLSIPQAGRYYTYVEVPSLGITYRDLPHLTLRGTPRDG